MIRTMIGARSSFSSRVISRRGGIRAALGALREEAGQAMVEFALMLLPILMVVFGIIRFGILFDNYITLTNATAYGARTLAVNRGQGTGPPTACTMAQNAVVTAAPTLNNPVFTTSDVTVTIAGDTSNCTALIGGQAATVQATYPCDLQVLLFNVWPSCTLTSQVTVAVE